MPSALPPETQVSEARGEEGRSQEVLLVMLVFISPILWACLIMTALVIWFASASDLPAERGELQKVSRGRRALQIQFGFRVLGCTPPFELFH